MKIRTLFYRSKWFDGKVIDKASADNLLLGLAQHLNDEYSTFYEHKTIATITNAYKKVRG